MYKANKWSLDTILQVWRKAQILGNNDPNKYRVDACGAIIALSAHGDRDSQYGWELDHIRPVALGGSDMLSNLQPLHWKNNLAKGDSLHLKCAISRKR